MTYAFRKARPDANQAAIIAELEAHSVRVLDLSSAGDGIPDLLTWHRERTVLIELKSGVKDAYLKRSQIELMVHWPGHCGIAVDAAAAVRLATEPERYALTAGQKLKLGGFATKMAGKQARLSAVLKVIE